MTTAATPINPTDSPDPAGPKLHQPTPATPLTPEEQHIWTTVYLAETCRASEMDVADRVDRAYELADDATDAFRDKMAACRPLENPQEAIGDNEESAICGADENDANQGCCGV